MRKQSFLWNGSHFELGYGRKEKVLREAQRKDTLLLHQQINLSPSLWRRHDKWSRRRAGMKLTGTLSSSLLTAEMSFAPMEKCPCLKRVINMDVFVTVDALQRINISLISSPQSHKCVY